MMMPINIAYGADPGILSAINDTIPGGIANILRNSLGVAALLAFGVIIYAGIVYSMARGNESKVKDAKDRIVSAVKGIAILAFGYIILTFINPQIVSQKDFNLLKLTLDTGENIVIEYNKLTASQRSYYSSYQSNPSGFSSTKSLPPAETGNPALDTFINTANGYMGYQETGNNYTPFGEWYGLNGGDKAPWCAMFVSYCADKAGILGTVVPKYAGVLEGKGWYESRGKYKTRQSGYSPHAGDVIVINWNGTGKSDDFHTGIVTAFDPITKVVFTIEGNRTDMVKRGEYSMNNINIHGYGINGGSSFGTIPVDSKDISKDKIEDTR